VPTFKFTVEQLSHDGTWSVSDSSVIKDAAAFEEALIRFVIGMARRPPDATPSNWYCKNCGWKWPWQGNPTPGRARCHECGRELVDTGPH
jgi:hypothetical protein